MRNDFDVAGFGHGCDLLGSGQAAAQADIRPDVGRGLSIEELLVLEDAGKALAGGDGDIALGLDFAHDRRAVGQHGVFVEVRVKLFKAAAEPNRLGGIHLAVDFDAEVDAIANGFAQRTDAAHGFVGPLGVGLVQVVVGCKGREAEGGEALLHLGQAIGDECVERIAADVHVAADLVAGFAAHQVVDRHVEALALDVPEGDVNGRERSLDDRPHKVRRAVQPLVVMLDAGGVLANEGRGHGFEHGLGGALPAVDAALADADGAVFAVDFQEEPAVPEDRLQAFDFSGLHGTSRGECWESRP